MIDTFQHLPVLQLKFRLIACEDFAGFPILGSTLRGAFGSGLKRAACTVRNGECPSCLLNSACHYTNIFDPQIGNNVPRPFTFQIPVPPLNPKLSIEESLRLRIRAGGSISFGITVFGENTHRHIPYIVAGIENLASHGIGMPRKKFRLVEVSAGDSPVYRDDGKRSDLTLPRLKSLYEICTQRMDCSAVDNSVTIRMLTPIWMREDRRLVERPTFFHIIKFIIKRLQNVFAHHSFAKLDLDETTLLDASREVVAVNETIWRHDFSFYSNRRRRTEPQTGVLGEIIFKSKNLGMFIPLLIAGEALHVGSKTSFGLGRYVIR